jgi:RNA polymerase sigma-54 factor
MGMRQAPLLKQSQNLAMHMQIQQKLKILTLSRQELENFIGQEIKENPCLEEGNDQSPIGDSEPVPLTQTPDFLTNSEINQTSQGNSDLFQGDDTGGQDVDLRSLGEALRNSSNQDTPASYDDNAEQQGPLYDRVNCEVSLLHDEILEQLRFMHLTDYEMECCEILIQFMDDNGFFQDSFSLISEQTDLPVEDLEYALSCIQKCEPVGVGARDIKECLLLQLKANAKAPYLAVKIVKEAFSLFEKQEILKISKLLKAEPEPVKKSMLFIRENTDPRPARQFGQNHHSVITPDVYIFKREGEWVASVNEDGLPRIKLSEKYTSLLNSMNIEKALKGNELKKYLSEKFKQARWILTALQDRNKTILRVAECILQRQLDFLELGPEHLKPMVLKDLAGEIGVHESTISRATSMKYVHTPRGIFELKYFFNTSVEGEDGQELSNEAVKVWVAELVKAEDPKKPLSDQELADKIEATKNVKVARRTVSKYRESLGILSSSKRVKRF